MMWHFDIHLRDTQTGVAVVWHDGIDHIPSDVQSGDALFIWEDGNYACDCNRSLFLGWAQGLTQFEGLKCGDSRIAIDKIVVRETGDVVAEDL